MKKTLIILGLLIMVISVNAQRGGFDRSEMVQREKEMVFSKVTDLSPDQKLLLNGIYEEYGVTMNETIDEIRQSRDYSQFRTKVPALQKEKDLLVKDVLSAEQYVTYEQVINNTGLGLGRGQRSNNDENADEVGPADRSQRPGRNRPTEQDTIKVAQ